MQIYQINHELVDIYLTKQFIKEQKMPNRKKTNGQVGLLGLEPRLF